jgi:mannosyltransferase OCH1-like enzyme
MIPKIIHQIWVGPYRIPTREKQLIENIKNLHPTFEHMFWTDENIPELPPVLKEVYDLFGERKHYTFQADLLRIYLMYEYGGLYLDADFECREGFNNFDLENYDTFFSNHYGNVDTFTCGTFGASKNNPIFKYFVDTMINQYPQRYWYGPSFYADVLKEYFNCEEKDISHNEFARRYFDNNRILYINFDEFHLKYFWHHALYSWSPIMEKTFKEGNYE